VTAFAFLSKQYPDLTLLAHSPAVEALGVAEQVFPALRPSEAVDRHPLVAPRSLPPDATPALPGARLGRPHSWLGVAASSLLATVGLATLARVRAGGVA
jgi:hypothetical protein